MEPAFAFIGLVAFICIGLYRLLTYDERVQYNLNKEKLKQQRYKKEDIEQINNKLDKLTSDINAIKEEMRYICEFIHESNKSHESSNNKNKSNL